MAHEWYCKNCGRDGMIVELLDDDKDHYNSNCPYCNSLVEINWEGIAANDE